MTTDLWKLPGYQARKGLLAKEFSASELVESHLSRLKSLDSKVRAFVTVIEDDAIARAEYLDRKIASGASLGRLAGYVMAIKDNINIRGLKTTCSSKILENYTALYDAFVVERLRAEDAIFIGKTNLDEFAMGSSTENSAFFTTKNPWDLKRTPGGSSGGSAAAVTAGFANSSLGSDTGGSIRQPAALTGSVGFKPTYGFVSRYGLVAFASSLDQIGPICRTVTDCAAVSDVIVATDENDSTSIRDIPKKSFLKELDGDMSGVKIGIPEKLIEGCDAEVSRCFNECVKKMQKAGAVIENVELNSLKYGVPTYYIIAPCEASSNLARYCGVGYGLRKNGKDSIELMTESRNAGFGPEVKRRILIGTFALSSGYYDAYYVKALRARRLIKNDYDSAFLKVDFILTPTTPTPAFLIGEKVDDPLQMYLCDVFTVTANLAGIPAVSVPGGMTSANLPIGIQFQGKGMDDHRLLAVARWFEKLSGMENLLPQLV